MPTWSASSNGPIGNPARKRIAASIVSIGTRSVSWIHAASSKYGPRTRVVMNPGTSFFTTTTVFPRDLARPTAASKVVSSVVSARITSTNGMSIGGLKKCIPTTLWGRFVARAMLVIGKADVFDARIASFGAARSSSRNTRFFRSRSSKMASITMAASRVAWARSVVTRMRASTSSLCSGRIWFFSTSLPRDHRIRSIPRSRSSCLTSRIATSWP